MAAPTDAGLGLGVHDGEAVHEHEKKGAHGLGLSAEDPIGFDDKNEDEEEDEEEVPVAKKARVEKADNGVDDEGDDDDEGLEGFAEKDADETELDPLLGHDNGAAESPVEGDADDDDDDDDENGGVGAADDDDEDDDESAEVDTAPAKDASGDAGLRTLLHEGDAKTNLLNGTGADLHTLNGAK